MSADTIPSFKTERLLLRGVELEDAESYEKYFVNYEVIKHLSHFVPWPYPAGGVRDYLENLILPEQGLDRWMWVICEKDSPKEVIGAIELWRDGNPENRGFWLGQPFWGLGYMSEAVIPVTDYAFQKLGFEKLIFSNALGNERSKRIKEKSGAKFLGVRPAKFVNPDYTEHEVWELCKSDWITRGN